MRPTPLLVFKAQIDYLIAQGVVFMTTPYEYYNKLNGNSTISLERIGYDQYDQVANSHVQTDLTLNGNTLVSITNGAEVLAENTDYTKVGDTITISETYLDNCLTGKKSFCFNFSGGKAALLQVDLVNTDPTAKVAGTLSNILWKGVAADSSNVSAVPSLGAPVVDLYDAALTPEQMVTDAQKYALNKLNNNAYAMYSNRLI